MSETWRDIEAFGQAAERCAAEIQQALDEFLNNEMNNLKSPPDRS